MRSLIYRHCGRSVRLLYWASSVYEPPHTRVPRAVISTFARFKQAGCQITQYAIYDDNTSESLVVNFCGGDRDMTKDARPTKIDEGATNAVGFSAFGCEGR